MIQDSTRMKLASTKVDLNERFALTNAKPHLYHRAALGSMFATLLSF
jgi:hypothetical protein